MNGPGALAAYRRGASPARAVNGVAARAPMFEQNQQNSNEDDAVQMRVSTTAGRADPFGLLVLVVLLAVAVTVGIQARGPISDVEVGRGPVIACEGPCAALEGHH